MRKEIPLYTGKWMRWEGNVFEAKGHSDDERYEKEDDSNTHTRTLERKCSELFNS